MTSSQEQITKDHNLRSAATEKLIQDSANRLADIDAARAELNEEAKEIREALKDIGILPAAFMSKYAQFKKLRRQQEEYTQSEDICYNALAKMNQDDLFGWMDMKKDDVIDVPVEADPAKPQKSIGEEQAKAVLSTMN